jgi:hypothetical protein
MMLQLCQAVTLTLGSTAPTGCSRGMTQPNVQAQEFRRLRDEERSAEEKKESRRLTQIAAEKILQSRVVENMRGGEHNGSARNILSSATRRKKRAASKRAND